ncbi:MAG: sugar ABC transporter permease [Planctomycetota bacterium]|jgi:multiple sugar transport system permease protein|nr:sugar ABC transporter permease [Planctomycetota bacterium]
MTIANPAAARARPRRRRFDALPYVLVSPAVLATLTVVFYPMLTAAGMSFYDYVIWRPSASKFLWFDNYLAALRNDLFWTSFWHTLVWIGTTVPLQLLLGLATALLLNQKFAWRWLARMLIIIPWALPSVVIALMWRWIYDANYGALNDFLLRLRIIEAGVPWLATTGTALYSIIFVLIWQGFPFFAVMLLAGLQSIPRELYEAVEVDGAGLWGRFRHVTLPGLHSVLATSVLLRLIWVANSVDVIYIMTGGGPGTASYTLPLYAYVQSRQVMKFGFASALAVLFTLMLMTLVVMYLRRVDDSGGMKA